MLVRRNDSSSPVPHVDRQRRRHRRRRARRDTTWPRGGYQ